jgi:hypothetical protein
MYNSLNDEARAALEQSRAVLARMERDWVSREEESARFRADNQVQTQQLLALCLVQLTNIN